MIKKDILSYIAGYLDGDGCFNIRKETIGNRFKYPAQLIITSTNVAVLRFIQTHIGGSVHLADARSSHGNQKPNFRFCLCGKASGVVVEKLLPFLIERKKQARCYIKFTATKDKIFKDQLIAEMKHLKHSVDRVAFSDIALLKSIKFSKTIDDYEYPYLAGFIDAECSLGIYTYKAARSKNKLYKCTLQCANTKLSCFTFLMSRFGGAISFVKTKGNSNAKMVWKLSGIGLKELLPKLLPFMVTKMSICVELIRFNNLILPNGGARHTELFRQSYLRNLIERETIRQNINLLNHRGLKPI